MPIALTLPPWTRAYARRTGEVFDTLEARVELAIDLARRNVEERTGGPFGAAVFERDSGALVAVGVNVVEALGLSVGHAEILALCFAQKRVGTFDLGARRLPEHELVSSAQPCAMCAGALVWSGVTRIVYAATRKDVEQIVGFDEGPLAPGWKSALAARGITVQGGHAREAAASVLRQYLVSSGTVYNSSRGS